MRDLVKYVFQFLPGLVHTYLGHWLCAKILGVPMTVTWYRWGIREQWDGTADQSRWIAAAGFGAEFAFAFLCLPLALLWPRQTTALLLFYGIGAIWHWFEYPWKHKDSGSGGDFDDLCPLHDE